MGVQFKENTFHELLARTNHTGLSINVTSNSKYLMVNSWLQLISLLISYENLVLDQDSNLCLISLSIIITSCWIIYGYIMRRSYALITSESERGLVSGCADLFKQLIYRKVVCPDSMLSILHPTCRMPILSPQCRQLAICFGNNMILSGIWCK